MPIKLSDSPPEVERSPLLGEHTDEVLGWLGYGDGDIKKLHDDGAV
jgi:formyl-CoA transferase